MYNRQLTIILFNCQTRKSQTFTVRNVLNMARYIFHFNPIARSGKQIGRKLKASKLDKE